MDKEKQSTKKITYILVSALTIVAIILAIPGMVSEATNVSVEKKKAEMAEEQLKNSQSQEKEPQTKTPNDGELFEGEVADSIDKKIMKSEREWGTDVEDPKVEKEDDETNSAMNDEETDSNQEDYWTNPEENQPPQGGTQNQEQPGNQEGENNPPEEPDEGHIHTYGDWVRTSEPTCIVAGSQTRTCSCGHSETMAIPATGHTWSEDLEVVSENYCGGCGHDFGPNPSSEELFSHQYFDESGNPRDADGQALHTPVSVVRKYHSCIVCGWREELQ